MHEAEELATERNRLFDRLQRQMTDLQNALKSDYRNIVVAGKEYSPKDAAKKVAEGMGKHDWIPAPVALGEPLPLSVEEILELYSTNTATTADDDTYVDIALPPLDKLPKPDAFSQWLSRTKTVKDTLPAGSANGNEFWARSQFKQSVIRKLDVLKKRFEQLGETASQFDDWRMAAVSDGRNESTRAIWEELLVKIAEAKISGETAEHVSLKFTPKLGDGPDRRAQRQLLSVISSHLQSGGRLSRFQLALRPSWRRAIQGWRVQ